MVTVKVNPGACGLPTTINVDPCGPMKVKVTLDSACEHVDNMSKELGEIDAYPECFKNGNQPSKIIEISSRHCQHYGCPVPMAIIKGIEVAMGVSKPVDVEIKISAKDRKQD